MSFVWESWSRGNHWLIISSWFLSLLLHSVIAIFFLLNFNFLPIRGYIRYYFRSLRPLSFLNNRRISFFFLIFRFSKLPLLFKISWIISICFRFVSRISAGYILFDDSPLLLNMFLVGPWFRFFFISFAGNQMNEVIFVGDRSIALSTRLGSRLAFLEVSRVGSYRYIQLTIFTVLWFWGALGLMIFEFTGREGAWAMRAVFLFMKFFFMFFLVVDVIHLMTNSTFFDIPAAVSKVCAYFTLGKQLSAVVASLLLFVVHWKLVQNQNL